MTPKFKQMVLIKCINCPQYVKADGQTVCEHTELESRTVKGEKAAICRKCRGNARVFNALICHAGNWTPGKILKPWNETENEKQPA